MTKAAVVAFVALAAVVHGQVGRAPSRGIAARSSEVDAKVEDLTSRIAWHSSLDEAKAAAAKTGKPIFWMHMLGTLSGST